MANSLPSEVRALNEMIGSAIALSGHDPSAADDLLACLVAGAGLLIAFRTAGDPVGARILCERTAVGVVREAWAQAGMLSDVGGA